MGSSNGPDDPNFNRKSKSGVGISRRIIIYAAIGIIVVAAVSFTLFRGSIGLPSSISPPDASLANNTQQNGPSFAAVFCGLQTSANSTEFVTELVLPRECEMPLGIAVVNNQIWYVSTQLGVLGSYNLGQQKFQQEYAIPDWPNLNSKNFGPQVWAVKPDSQGNIWFTDERNKIWKFNAVAKTFDSFDVPVKLGSFGNSTYPASFDFDASGNLYLVGVHSPTLWYGDLSRMKNGTSNGFSEIPLPLGGFAAIDKDLISAGSVAVDKARNMIWVSLLAFQQKGEIFRYDVNMNRTEVFDLPITLTSPVGTAIDDFGDLWVTDHGTSTFFKLDAKNGKVEQFVTSIASSKIYGGNVPNSAYTLPYWIEKAPDGSLWFNEHEGNKITKFDPSNLAMVEYWIPSQNGLMANCPEGVKSCGIANALQLAVGNDNQIWFTEWTENKIGSVDTKKPLPFTVSTSSNELTVKKGQSAEIKIIVNASAPVMLNMLASGNFTLTGQLGNSTGTFSEKSASFSAGEAKEISFIFTAAQNLKGGRYTLMLGAGSDDVSILRALKVNVL